MKRCLLICLFVLSAFIIGACGQSSPDPINDETSLVLSRIKDGNELSELFNHDYQSPYRMLEESTTDDSVGAPQDGFVDEGETQDHSETNVQVEGVDEGDIIKTDGNRVYSISGNRLFVIEVNNGSAEIVFETAIDNNAYGHYTELYLTDRFFVAISNQSTDVTGPYPGDDVMIMPRFYGWYASKSVVEIYWRDTLEHHDTFTVDGHLQMTRMIDETLYFVSNHQPMRDEADMRPTLSLGDDPIMPDYESIVYLPGLTRHSMAIIGSLKLDDELTLDYEVFLGSFGWSTHYYMNKNGLYIATETMDVDWDDFRWNVKGVLIAYERQEDGTLNYDGSGSYKGSVLNQFSMDEYNGYFRMVTTEGWGDDVVNRLYVFEKNDNEIPELDVVGLIDEGLGKPRETVRSARFDGDQATVVTFELMDPFYIIDLSDPTNPVITGELEITGFSTYQHNWDEGIVLGIGYESSGIGVDGIKLSLYSTLDPEDPQEIGTPLVLWNDDGYYFSEALHNHLALLIEPERDYFAFSVYRHGDFDGRYYYISDYMIFDVDPSQDTPITVGAEITHMDLYGEIGHDIYTFLYYGYNIRRAVRIGDDLVVVSGVALSLHAIDDDYALQDVVRFYTLDE